MAYSQIRRFVVVRSMVQFCYACPVFTYSGRATLKQGVRPREHAVIYTAGSQISLLPGETGITKDSIAVDSAPSVPPLNKCSRLYFGIHHPIQYNVKVKDLGMVSDNDIPKMIGYWREELQNVISSQ
ncbi:hypothetical protein BDV95DRAFT_500966 [Massariosphaeria phaeospora]|uniref:DUF6590 domain-containing protein n=1 Tax=Massariosphaeria phaeospora TaxID=100035 RepID=A0A7C8I1D5_9PLEO|nr:hypothetical protein BDV95DRAFT_500966 [Massariosphaeria phaeospora]